MASDNSPVRFKDQAHTVETQAPGLDDNSLADARRFIGVDYRGARATIEITADNIRDFCNYMGSENPLPNVYGDATWCRGRVTRRYRDDGLHLVDLAVWCDNQRGQETARGQATVALPNRGQSEGGYGLSQPQP